MLEYEAIRTDPSRQRSERNIEFIRGFLTAIFLVAIFAASALIWIAW